MLETKRIVESRIGRPVEDCWNAVSGKGVLHFSDPEAGEVNIWCPDMDTCLALALDLLNHYRGSETFAPSERELWPYVEPYSSTKPLFGDMCVKSESDYAARLLTDATVYDYAAQALVFSDGVQAQDPFVILLTRAIDRAQLITNWNASDEEFPAEVERQLQTIFAQPGRLTSDGRNFEDLWASALYQYVRIREVYEAGYVRFVPGRIRLEAAFRLTPEDRIRTIQSKLERVMRDNGVDPGDTPECFAYLRAYQTMLESGAYIGASPLFLDTAQWDAAMAIFRTGALAIEGVDRRRLAQAALSSNLTIEPPSQSELVVLRRDEELFGRWREIRLETTYEIEKLFLRDAPSAQQISDLVDIEQNKWNEKLDEERRRNSNIAKKFDLQTTIIFGLVVGAATAAATAVAGPVPLGALIAAGGAGASGVVGVPLYNYLGAKKMEKDRAEALHVFEKHMMCLADRKAA